MIDVYINMDNFVTEIYKDGNLFTKTVGDKEDGPMVLHIGGSDVWMRKEDKGWTVVNEKKEALHA